jgi:hypothetical protein
LNTWESLGAPPSPVGATGLKNFRIGVPGPERWHHIQSAITQGILAGEALPEGWLVRDPSGNGVIVSASPGE